MSRVVTLLIVLAHLGVASIPCFDAEGEGAVPVMAGAHDSHHALVQPAPMDEALADGRDVDAHAHHRHGDQAEPQVAEVEPQRVVVLHELRASCLCGCSKRPDSPGTTTSSRLGFALLPPEPTRLIENLPLVDAPPRSRLPAPPADLLDHVPIYS